MGRRKPAYDAPASGDSGSWIVIRGVVTRLIPDDPEIERHQRMIVDIGAGRTLLVTHNLDVSRRVPAGLGDRVEVRGMFEWNDRGGLLHWTHDDPFTGESAGYIRLRGACYR